MKHIVVTIGDKDVLRALSAIESSLNLIELDEPEYKNVQVSDDQEQGAENRPLLVRDFDPTIRLSEEEKSRRGARVAQVLMLRHRRSTKQFDTMWGGKTTIGLYETVKRLIEQE